MEERNNELNARIDLFNTQTGERMEEIRMLLCAQLQEHGTPAQTQAQPRPKMPVPQQQHYATRISKVEFPRFDGKNVRDWLYKCDQLFSLDDTPQASKVRLHLDGLAL